MLERRILRSVVLTMAVEVNPYLNVRSTMFGQEHSYIVFDDDIQTYIQ